jgi:hypothetical protein
MFTSHEEFYRVCARQIAGANAANLDREIVVLGAVELFWEHKKNVAYLNRAMQVARSVRGLRVNAVRAFLTAMTGAKWKGDAFIKGGDMAACPDEFAGLGSWTDWANEKAAEPEYDAAKAVAALAAIMHKRAEIARANGAAGVAEQIEAAMHLVERAA